MQQQLHWEPALQKTLNVSTGKQRLKVMSPFEYLVDTDLTVVDLVLPLTYSLPPLEGISPNLQQHPEKIPRLHRIRASQRDTEF